MYESKKPFIKDYDKVRVRSRGYLPHWEAPGGVYFVTFRLADSLPLSAIVDLKQKRLEFTERVRKKRARRPRYGGRDGRAPDDLTIIERQELARLFGEKVDEYLDAGMGACELGDPRAAEIVKGALHFFHGKRYNLDTWCVMPNHVHAIFEPMSNWTLDQILFSWKSFTAHMVNRALARSGQLWQEEYFDRLIRDEEDLVGTRAYILENPLKAGLREWRWVGRKVSDS